MENGRIETRHTFRHRINNDTYINLFMLAVFAALVLIASFVVPSFMGAGSFLNILAQQSYLILIGISVTFLLLTGNFDLSVGSVASCAAVLSVFFCQPTEGSASELGMNTGFGLPVAAAMLLALLVCLGIGALNAVFIVRYRIASVIVTLGTMYIARGIARVVAQGAQRNLGLPASFTKLGLTSFGEIGLPVIIMAAAIAVALIVEKKTEFGRNMYYIGANKEAAEISGVRVGRQLASLYMASALMAGFVGIMIASKFKSGSSYAADGFEFDALAATILGGTSIRGGSGSVVGLLIGVFIFGTLSTCLNQLGLPPATQTVSKGIVLVIAVVAQQFAIARRGGRKA